MPRGANGTGSSQYQGVSLSSSGRWIARVRKTVEGKSTDIHCGTFTSEVDAAQAYDRYAAHYLK